MQSKYSDERMSKSFEHANTQIFHKFFANQNAG